MQIGFFTCMEAGCYDGWEARLEGLVAGSFRFVVCVAGEQCWNEGFRWRSGMMSRVCAHFHD
jgi:hypothetical protein